MISKTKLFYLISNSKDVLFNKNGFNCRNYVQPHYSLSGPLAPALPQHCPKHQTKCLKINKLNGLLAHFLLSFPISFSTTKKVRTTRCHIQLLSYLSLQLSGISIIHQQSIKIPKQTEKLEKKKHTKTKIYYILYIPSKAPKIASPNSPFSQNATGVSKKKR